MKKEKINYIIKIAFALLCMAFAIPSIKYMIEIGTLLNFNTYFKFLMNYSDRLNQTLIYLAILLGMTILYFLIIRNRKDMFKNNKQMWIYITIISIIFVLVVPFMCSDVFYYIGIGRINSEYGQNPYYTTIKDFVEQEDNKDFLEQDTVLAQAYQNDWANSTVVYGPIWTIICSIIAKLSFGNIDVGILLFKLINLSVHLFNCYMIYKISNKKVFALLYGINPFVLIEGIAMVHNDIFIVLFTLLSIYFLLKKKNIILSLIFLAIATAIKYFTILLLPFMLIYYFREHKPSKRFIKCVEYGIIFLIMLIIPYLIYVKDFQVISGLFIQQEKLAKNFYIMLKQYFSSIPDVIEKTKNILLGTFIIIYSFTCIIMLNKKDIKFSEQMKVYEKFLMAFIFLLITNFQPWYIFWLFPCIMWQKSDNIKMIIGLSIISQFANAIFLLNGEGWKNGTPFTFIMITSSLVYYNIINKKRIRMLQNKKEEKIWKS